MYVSNLSQTAFVLETKYGCKTTLFFDKCKKIYYFCEVMIQRIQTIWIILSMLGALFLFITGRDVAVINQDFWVPTGCIVLIILGGLSIFSFKSRKRQIMLNRLSIIINALLIGVLGYWLLNLSGGIVFPEKGIEPVFPLISLVCLLIANVYIKRDERLVKSVDRLR